MKTLIIRTMLLLAPCAALVADEPGKLDKLLPNGWDPALAGDIVMQRLINVSAPQVKGTHDAEFVCIGDRAYIVTEANDRRAGESSGWPFIYVTMSIVNLKTLALEKVIDFARSEQVFENETLPFGQCFVPRILQKDAKTLRCYFTSQDPGKRQSQMWYLDFDLERAAFENRIYRAKLKTAAGTFDMQPQHFYNDAAAQGFRRPAKDAGLFIFDSFKQFDGKTYVALNNFPVGQNALALVHDDLATFEVLGHYNEPQSQQLSESAVNRLPDGAWMAICRNDKGNYHFTTSQDGRTWTVGKEMPFVPNGSNSKPTFDHFGGLYYLGWQDATLIGGQRRTIFNLDISRDGQTWERKYRFETPLSFQYPTFHEHQGAIWLTVTQGALKDRIVFGKLEDVGQFESQAGRKRIEWPAPLPADSAILKAGVKLFTDREYVADELPEPVRGLPFLRTSIEKLAVEITKPGTLFALTPSIRPKAASQEEALRQAGFTKVETPEVQLFPGEINRVSLYRKDVKTGERLSFSKLVVLVTGSGAEVKPCAASEESKYLAVVKRAVDVILENGRDTYGEQHSGMILSVLDRSTGKPMRLLPAAPNGVRRGDRTGPGGSNANMQQDLYRAMQHLSRLTGAARYADAVQGALADFMRITQHPDTGLLAWGEHLYWNCVEDRLGDLDPNKTHEQKRKFIYFDQLHASDPERTLKYARGLWEHQIADHETGNFSRHAKYDRHKPGRDYDFAKEGGYFIDVWSQAYAKTRDPVFAQAVQVLARRYLGRMSHLGLLSLDSTDRPDWLNTCVTLYLVALAVECADAAPRMDADSAAVLQKLTAAQDRAFLALAHELDKPERGFVSYAATDTGKPQPVAVKQSQGYSRHWNLGYGVHSTAMIALLCHTRQAQLGDTEQAAAYRKLVLGAADLYHKAQPDPVTDDLWAGEYGMVILNQLAAYRLTQRETYLTSARIYADEAIRIFWDADKPLPRASTKTDYYDVISSPDTLMLALLAVHEHVAKLDPRVEISDLIR